MNMQKNNMTSNLQSVTENSAMKNKYTYDVHDRLEWEYNYALGIVVKHFYDSNGNITLKQTFAITDGEISSEPIKSDTYNYTTITPDKGQNSSWSDQLKSYNGQAIEYNAYGSPTSYLGKTMVWKGKKLKSINGTEMEYDCNGLRVKKGNKKYFMHGDKLIFETEGNSIIYYYYDESGISGININGTDYYFQKNIFGDVVAIYNVAGTLLCKYVYDAWGNHKIYDSSGNEISSDSENIGNINPIRYRGYYWDREFGLYYLQSRYYDPVLGRFISPDSTEYVDPASVFGFNLYAYCNDNPVMYTDPSGRGVLLTIIEQVFVALAHLGDYLVTKCNSKVGHVTKRGGNGYRAAVRASNIAKEQTAWASALSNFIASAIAILTLGIDIVESWIGNYNSGNPNWVSASIVDTYYIGMRFGISSVIITAFSMIPVPIIGPLLGFGIAFIVDQSITWGMEVATNTLSAIKSWAADVGQQIVDGWNSLWSWVGSWFA